MPNSSKSRALGIAGIFLAASAHTSRAGAQQQAQGFAVERFYPSAPEGGWFVMDELDMRGGLGGAASLTGGYALKPLRVTDSVQHLAVVSEQAFADFGFAATYDRWRLYLNLDAPLAISGQSGTIGDYSFVAPSVNIGATPDTFSDARIGVDARFFGGPRSRFRLGASAQLFVPIDRRADYDTDGTYRAMLRVLFAGALGSILTYAGQLGVQIRPLDDAPTPGSPQGSELLFGVAAGPKFPLGRNGKTVLVVGPEFFGESAFRSFLGSSATGLEGLLTGRIEGTGDDGPQLRVKLGTGGGLDQHFGAPEWRIVFGVEVFDHSGDRDKDGIKDRRDACPDAPGIKTDDPRTNGCPGAMRNEGAGR
jgi:OmpA-OmpF porin, OOP family